MHHLTRIEMPKLFRQFETTKLVPIDTTNVLPKIDTAKLFASKSVAFAGDESLCGRARR